MNEQRRPTLEELRAEIQQDEDSPSRQKMLACLGDIEEKHAILDKSRRKRRKAGETRGGAREGAGRPELPDDERQTIRASVGFTQGEYNRMMAQAEPGEKKGTVIRRLVMLAVETLEREKAA